MKNSQKVKSKKIIPLHAWFMDDSSTLYTNAGKPKKEKVIPKTPRTPRTPKTAPSPRLRVENLQDMTKIKIGKQYLCTYNEITFFVRPAPVSLGNGFILIEELPNGQQEGMPGVFKTVDSAMLYFKKKKDVSQADEDAIKNLKGGHDLKSIDWKKDDRIIYDDKGAYMIGTVRGVSRDFMTGLNSRIYIMLDNGQYINDLDVRSTNILGKGIAKQNTEPIPIKDIEKWLLKEKEKKQKGYIYILDKGLDLPVDLDKAWKGYCKKIFNGITDPLYKKMVQDYMSEYPIKIIEPDPVTGPLGSYQSMYNEVRINWKQIMKPDTQEAANTLVHEVIHYKLWPLNKQLLSFLKVNIMDILELDESDPKTRTWFKAYTNAKLNVPPITSLRVRKLLPKFSKYSHDILYGLTRYLESPTVYLSLPATGYKLPSPFDKLSEALFEKFQVQLKK